MKNFNIDMMENFEKAIEISESPEKYITDFNKETEIRLQRYNAAMLMAEWKDEQFDLLKWKKATKHKDLKKHVAILEEGKVLLSNYLEKGDYYIDLEDLKTLPKEE